MAWQAVKYRLTSEQGCPILFHNGQTADPLNKHSKQMKQISNKRNKTDADYEQMAKIEFAAGLYMAPDGPIIPADVIDAMLIMAAKKSKEGPIAKSGVFCARHASLVYDGPRTTDELWADERFRFVKRVKVGQASVMRTRPKFDVWEAIVEVNYEPEIVNPSRIDDWLTIAGLQVGLCDWRPRFGRFGAERVSV
jgi:hypothetical protein